MNLSVNCWITGQSPSALAEEISTYEANIQKDVYENHLKQGNRDDWNGYTLNLFKKHSEKYYTTDLEQYKFDKTECKACAHNAANYNLFAEHNGWQTLYQMSGGQERSTCGKRNGETIEIRPEAG